MADTYQVLNLAAIIRKVDGSNNKGAAALAESILDHPRFRAVLAGEPAVPEGREPASVTGQFTFPAEKPTNDEVEVLADQLGLIRGHANHPCGFWIDDGDAGALVRAALARWGNPAPPPPADGEVAELVAWLRETGDTIQPSHLAEHQRYKRAAELLQRQALVPVPVSERPWEREGWCDKHGQCWAFNKDLPAWEFLDHANSCKWADLFLPAHALPLPEAGE